MTILKVFMMMMPLISYPYIIRVVGNTNYGLVAYSLAVIHFFRILVLFGFELSAVKNIVDHRDDIEKKSEIVSSVLSVQMILYLIGLLILTGMILAFDQFKENRMLFYFAYLLPLCDILFLVWYFQAIEKMKYITIVNVVSGIFGLLLIFIVIKEKEDYVYVPLLQAISLLIGASISLWIVFRKEGVKLIVPTWENMLFYAKDSWGFFVSRVSAVFNTEINAILLANFVSLNSVAYYDLAKKIVEVFKVPNGIIQTVLYPYIAKTKDKRFAKTVLYIRILISVFLIGLLALAKNYIIIFLGGPEMMPTAKILMPLSIMILFTGITHYAGASLLVAFGHPKEFNLSVIYSTLLYLVFAGLLYITQITLINVICALLLVEFYIMVYRLYYCKKYKIL